MITLPIRNKYVKYHFVCILFFFICPPLSHAQKKDSIGNFGKASFYNDSFHGLETSNGETYDKDDFTAAHRKFPFNTILLVTNKKNNKSVVVRVNDRGPFKRSRIIDLSSAAAKKIGMVPYGIVQVRIKELNFLNPGLMDDSLLKEGEVWDCYGKAKAISDTALFLWNTKSWKHAFYMASCLSLDYHLNSIYVKISQTNGKKTFDLYVCNIEDKHQLNNLISTFKSDGFFRTEIIYNKH